MNEILFFPWLRLSKSFQASNFELLTYDKESSEEKINKSSRPILDDCLSFFKEDDNSEIGCATVILVNGKIEIELTEALEIELSLIIELVTFCGLSGRDFFRCGAGYCNKDNFHLKRFQANKKSVAYTVFSRRKDGSTKNIIPVDIFLERKPAHVSLSRVNLDEKLLHALILARSSLEAWENIFDGILNFNLSNTDSPYISESIELVFLVSSFERTLGTATGKENDLAQKFVEILKPSSVIELSSCERLKGEVADRRFRKCNSAGEAWIRDLFRLRGNLAHGRSATAYPSVWSLKEHLLLGSFVFPLVLKKHLQKQNKYIMSKYDDLSVDIFECLLCQKKIDRWNETWSNFLWNRIQENRSRQEYS